MNPTISFFLRTAPLTLLLFTPSAWATTEELPDLRALVAGKGWELSPGYRAEAIEKDGKPGVRIVEDGSGKAAKYSGATAHLTGSSFEDGTIDVDIQGPQGTEMAFIGIAFRIQTGSMSDTQKLDLVYFRPQKFGKPKKRGDVDGEVQYTAEPTFSWFITRTLVPLKYEKNIPQAPQNQAAWFHAKIVVKGAKVQVFVDGASKPCLVVNEALNGTTGRGMGLWTWPGGSFANLKITHARG